MKSINSISVFKSTATSKELSTRLNKEALEQCKIINPANANIEDILTSGDLLEGEFLEDEQN